MRRSRSARSIRACSANLPARPLHRPPQGGTAMRWAGGRRSGNIEDRRGMGVPLVAGGGIGTVVLLVLALFFGFDPGVILNTEAPPSGSTPEATRPSASPSTDT